MTPPSSPHAWFARARGQRVNVNSVVDLVVYIYILLFSCPAVRFCCLCKFTTFCYGLLQDLVNLAFAMYILLCFPVLSVGVLHLVNPVEVYCGI